MHTIQFHVPMCLPLKATNKTNIHRDTKVHSISHIFLSSLIFFGCRLGLATECDWTECVWEDKCVCAFDVCFETD